MYCLCLFFQFLTVTTKTYSMKIFIEKTTIAIDFQSILFVMFMTAILGTLMWLMFVFFLWYVVPGCFSNMNLSFSWNIVIDTDCIACCMGHVFVLYVFCMCIGWDVVYGDCLLRFQERDKNGVRFCLRFKCIYQWRNIWFCLWWGYHCLHGQIHYISYHFVHQVCKLLLNGSNGFCL